MIFQRLEYPFARSLMEKMRTQSSSIWYDSNSFDGLRFENFHKLLRGPRETKDEITLKR